MDAIGKGRRHVDKIVLHVGTQRAGAEGDAVVYLRHDVQKPLQILLVRDDARQPEHTPWRIVRMDRHVDADLFRHRNDRFQKGLEIFPKSLFAECGIGGEQVFKLRLCIARVPARQRQIALQRIHRPHGRVVIRQRMRTVRLRVLQLAAQPVKHRHEVIADALDARLCQPPHILTVVFDHAGGFLCAELDVLRHRHALHHLKGEFVRRSGAFHLCDALLAPYLSRRHIVYRRNDTGHAGDLRDLLQGHGIVLAVPAKCQLHLHSSVNFRMLS